ncbi:MULTISPECIES: NUDIX hydrolase [Parabacteroides]|uniref:NUDIX hydrolase N-terminal domain-containing protein n=1 Tax=Parabacteroides leei TaxID=2939491 RepID=UPI00189AAD7D|nr:NUDIX hydrolase [Parabacteroides goldsteinii]
MNENQQPKWLEWAKELQFIAQAGLTYSKDAFDIERFERIREISAEILSLQSGLPLEKIKNLFCNEEGFQTPKLDSRAAIFKDNKILLVKEKNGTWSLPGGWVDVNQTIKTNTVKEVKEEAGLDVETIRIIAVQDRNLHNLPPYAYNVCKVFVLCEVKGGAFQPNIETVESGYFNLDEIPPLAEEKNNREQVEMCFAAYHDKDWVVQFD